MSFEPLTSSQLAQMILLRGTATQSWLAVIPTSLYTSGITGFIEELSVLTGERIGSVILNPDDLHELPAQIHMASERVLVLAGLDGLTKGAWGDLDLMRSALEREGLNILWMPGQATDELANLAPNIRSFIGGDFFCLVPEAVSISDQEREVRLATLREHFGKSDEEVVELARNRNLPVGPSYAEWLVLLDRGDLL